MVNPPEIPKPPPIGTDPDRAAFGNLLAVHGASLHALLRRLCRQSSDADDVFQETAVRIWRNFDRLPRLRNPRSWLLVVGYRAYVDWLNARNRPIAGEDASLHGDPKAETADRIAERRDECRRLENAVERLDEEGRRIVILHYSGGMSLREIAGATGLPVGTVKSRLNAALVQLRRTLS